MLRRKFWEWPDGLVWKITEKFAVKSRKKKFDLFMSVMKPKPEDKILDVGVSSSFLCGRGINFFELWYPHQDNITALANEDKERFANFRESFPKVNLVFGDGKKLNFPDNKFDIVFSNAVVEHTGELKEQKNFIYEVVRVSKRAFITTPSYWFPIDTHTLIPFAHWLPQRIRFWIYKKARRGHWADMNRLNLLTPKKFLECFPPNVRVKLYRGISLIAIVEKD